MFRKFLTSGIAALGLAVPVMTSAPADAHDFHHHHHHHESWYFDCDYVVFYRYDSYSPWMRYGRFESEWEARRVARQLEWRGFEVFMQAR